MSSTLASRSRTPRTSRTAALDDWVAAPPFRALLRQLVSDSGLSWRVLARAAGVPATTVLGLLRGAAGRPATQLRHLDAAKLWRLSLRSLNELASEQADPAALRSLTWRLGLRGCTVEQIATLTGLPPNSIRKLMAGGNVWCSRLQVIRAEAACEALDVDLATLPNPTLINQAS